MAEDKKQVKGYIGGPAKSHQTEILGGINTMDPKYSKITEAFKSRVDDEQIKFPKELGAKHPFDIEKVEKVINHVGLINSSVDKITDSIIGKFSIEVIETKKEKEVKEDKGVENAQAIIDSFVADSDLISHLKPWIKEGVGKGGGFMDLTDIQNDKIRVINAKEMYVDRTKTGEIKGYNQFLGGTNKIKMTEKNTVSFTPAQIAHLSINTLPGEPYGLGMVWPNIQAIEHYAGIEIDRHKLISRKAGAPIHAKMGQPGESVQSTDIDAMAEKLQYMNNRTEWVTDGNTEMKVIDFGDVGKSLTEASRYDVEQIAMGMRIPMVLMGVANVAEGLAKAQQEDYDRFISSVRVVVEATIESTIIKPLLLANGMDASVNFIWDMPGEDEKNARLEKLQSAMSSPMVGPELHAELEREYARILGFDELVDILPTPEEARKLADEEKAKQEAEAKAAQEATMAKAAVAPKPAVKKPGEANKKKEQNLKQPEVPGAKPTATLSQEVTLKEMTEEQIINMPLSEYVNITEIPGFNFSDYLVKILQRLKIEKFDDLRALTEQDIIQGLLPENDIEKLRIVLKDGFKKNKTILEIEKDINTSIDLKDRLKDKEGQLIVTAKAEKRPVMIARTETVRLANAGLKDLYTENKVDRYRYLAALDDRTSDVCLTLNGQVFDTVDGLPGVNMPPMHANCRSTIVGIIE